MVICAMKLKLWKPRLRVKIDQWVIPKKNVINTNQDRNNKEKDLRLKKNPECWNI